MTKKIILLLLLLSFIFWPPEAKKVEKQWKKKFGGYFEGLPYLKQKNNIMENCRLLHTFFKCGLRFLIFGQEVPQK